MQAAGLNPYAVLLLLGACAVVLFGSRQAAIKSFLAMAALAPLGQQFILMGLHFMFIRVLIAVVALRILTRREMREFKWQTLDWLFLFWALGTLVCSLLRGPKAEMFGKAYDALGMYFPFRLLIRDTEDVVESLRFVAVLAIVIAGSMIWEYVAQRNPFAVLGGVPAIPAMRHGRPRCQGPFNNNILAGCIGASLFPLMVGLWLKSRQYRKRAILGIIGSVIITATSISSGALLTFGAAGVGLALWCFRHYMRIFRRSVVVMILGLALVMKAPVWYIIARVSDLSGGGGWYRSFLINQFVDHFSQWWLIGTSYTANWANGGPVLAVDPNNIDITNQYVAQGIGGGIWVLGLFLAMLVVCFKIIGRAVKADDVLERADRKFVWAIGATLAAHCLAFMSISYFGPQIVTFLFWLFAAIVAVSTGLEQPINQVQESELGVAQEPVAASGV